MKKLRLFLLIYAALDLFIGGYNGGLLPLSLLHPQIAKAQQATPQNSTRASHLSFVAGKFVANEYGTYGGSHASQIYTGNASTGSATITVRGGYIVLLDGRKVLPFAVGVPIVINDSTPELVTPTAVSGCFVTQGMNQDGATVTCSITATFANTHGVGAAISSGTGGLAEAAYNAFVWGGGVVVMEPGLFLNTSCTNCYASVSAALAAIAPYQGVSFEDDRGAVPQYWSVQQTASTFLAVPSTLTATTVGFGLNGANATGGAYTGTSTYHVCVAYVDVAGQEGACSADFSGLTAGSSATTYQIGFAAPAASAGAVGYTVYISLASGTYSLAYQAPLTSSTCTLTKIETVTPACAVTNSTYGQTGSNAVISALTLATSPVDMQLGGVSGTLLTGNANGRTTYAYVSGNRVGTSGLIMHSLAFTAGGIGSATPISIGTVNIPAGFMNMVGKEIRICGRYANTDVNSSTQIINVYWDTAGSNSSGSPVKLSALTATGTGTAAVYEGSFCQTFTTTVSGAGATAGSIAPGFGNLAYALSTSGNIVGNGADNCVTAGCTAVGSLNLATTPGFSSRISIIHNNATGNATPQLQDLTIEVL